jgi:hypothetical protein
MLAAYLGTQGEERRKRRCTEKRRAEKRDSEQVGRQALMSC